MADKDPIKTLLLIEKNLDKKVSAIIWEATCKLKDKLKFQMLAGFPIGKRHQGIPVIRIRPRLVGTIIVGGIDVPVHWKEVHFGPPGSTTIRAKHGMLAIPTSFAKQGLGPKSRVYGPLVAINGMLYGAYGGAHWMATGKVGKYGGSIGLRNRRAAGESFKGGDLIPLFTLKESVIVKRRIDPKTDLIAWIEPWIMAEFKKHGLLKD